MAGATPGDVRVDRRAGGGCRGARRRAARRPGVPRALGARRSDPAGRRADGGHARCALRRSPGRSWSRVAAARRRARGRRDPRPCGRRAASEFGGRGGPRLARASESLAPDRRNRPRSSAGVAGRREFRATPARLGPLDRAPPDARPAPRRLRRRVTLRPRLRPRVGEAARGVEVPRTGQPAPARRPTLSRPRGRRPARLRRRARRRRSSHARHPAAGAAASTTMSPSTSEVSGWRRSSRSSRRSWRCSRCSSARPTRSSTHAGRWPRSPLSGVDERWQYRALAVPAAVRDGGPGGGRRRAGRRRRRWPCSSSGSTTRRRLASRRSPAPVVIALLAGLVLAVSARIAARLLRPLIRSAIDPENLRAA